MRILSGDEEKEALGMFDEAAKEASKSICLRAHGGSVIVKDGVIIGRGHNSTPGEKPENRTCLNEYEIPAGFRHDRTCCIHAEQRAIADALKHSADMSGARIYFANISMGDPSKREFSKNLKCTICSRAALDQGITEFALHFEDGVRVYGTKEYNELSYEYKTPKIPQ